MTGTLRRIAGFVGGVAVLLVGWHLVSVAIGSPALPGPAPAIAAFADAFVGELLPHLGISAARVFAALVIGLVLAAPLGLLLGRSPRADAVVAPLVFLTYPVPKVVFLPVFFVLLGTGNVSKVTIIAVIVFFQILVTARDASRAIPAGSVLSVRSLGAGRALVFWHVVVPASLPKIFTALRISIGTAIAVLFFSETFAGSDGLGYFIIDAWGRIQYSEMFAGIIAMALLGVAFYEALDVAEARICRWTKVGGGG